MLYNQPRASTVQATETCVLWALDRLTFKSILQDTGNTSKMLYSKFLNEVLLDLVGSRSLTNIIDGMALTTARGKLRQVPILSVLTQDEKDKLLDVLKPKDFDAGDIVMKEGDAGDAFYIVDEGSVICTKVIDGVETKVSDSLGHGKFFGAPLRARAAIATLINSRNVWGFCAPGELALIKNAPRAATVTAEVETSCVMITRDDFKRMMGPLSELLKKNQEMCVPRVPRVRRPHSLRSPLTNTWRLGHRNPVRSYAKYVHGVTV